MIEKIDCNIKVKELLANRTINQKDYITGSYKSKTDILEERVDRLEKELQTLKNNLYEVFFNEDLTSKK